MTNTVPGFIEIQNHKIRVKWWRELRLNNETWVRPEQQIFETTQIGNAIKLDFMKLAII